MILLALCGQAVSAQQIPGFEFDHFEFPGGEFFGEASCRVIGDADSSDINSFPKLFMTSCPPGFRAETFISSLGVPAELPGGTQEGFLVVLDAPVTLAANTSFTVAGLGRGSFESTTSLQNAQPPGMDPGCLNTITTPTTTGSTTLFPHEFECGINALSAVSEALPGPNQGLFFLGSSFIGTWTPATGAKLVIQYAIITSTGRRKVRTRLSLAALIPSRRPRNSLSDETTRCSSPRRWTGGWPAVLKRISPYARSTRTGSWLPRRSSRGCSERTARGAASSPRRGSRQRIRRNFGARVYHPRRGEPDPDDSRVRHPP